jgi:DNA primase
MYSPDTTKYLIHISLTAEGVVEKPDVVGAIFGQTEGLLGEDLDLRDLQRTGRVGRIDVQITSKKGETKGEILISTSLDRAETAILAASFETIDRVGPCIAHVTVESVEDIRVVKRKKIVERAKEILLDRFEDGTIDSDELLDDVRQSVRIEKIGSVGEERVPAGPHVLDSDAIIIVEGRADVLNLLRYGIKNAVAVEGTHIPKIVEDLCGKKTATAFFDGDRGGDLLLQERVHGPRGTAAADPEDEVPDHVVAVDRTVTDHLGPEMVGCVRSEASQGEAETSIGYPGAHFDLIAVGCGRHRRSGWLRVGWGDYITL